MLKSTLKFWFFYENGLSLMYIIVFYHNFRCNFGSSTVKGGESNNGCYKKRGESNNGCYKKTKHAKFGVLWFLVTPVLRFALLLYYRRVLNCYLADFTDVKIIQWTWEMANRNIWFHLPRTLCGVDNVCLWNHTELANISQTFTSCWVLLPSMNRPLHKVFMGKPLRKLAKLR